MYGLTISTLISIDGLVVLIILIDGLIASKLMVPIIPFGGSAASTIFIEILFDGTIASIIKASSGGVVIFSTFIKTSSCGLLPPFNEDEA